jgi:hypothetical protein
MAPRSGGGLGDSAAPGFRNGQEANADSAVRTQSHQDASWPWPDADSLFLAGCPTWSGPLQGQLGAAVAPTALAAAGGLFGEGVAEALLPRTPKDSQGLPRTVWLFALNML